MSARTSRTLAYTAVVLMAVTAVLSAYRGDWMWTIISAFALVMLLIPMKMDGMGTTFHERVVTISAVPYAAFIVLTLIDTVSPMEWYRTVSLIIQTLACMLAGYTMLLNLDINTDAVLSKRWLMVFSIAFACAFTVVYVFVLFPAMESMGFPLYNTEFEGPDALDNTEANRYQMLPMFITTFASIIYAFILRMYLKRIDKNELAMYYGGE